MKDSQGQRYTADQRVFSSRVPIATIVMKGVLFSSPIHNDFSRTYQSNRVLE